MKWQKNDDRDSRENQSVTKCNAYVAQYSHVPNKRGVLINRGVGKNSKI